MRTNLFAFVLGSETRKRIVVTIFKYAKRQWSCSALEDLTKTPHATVFRTLRGLLDYGLLKSTKINKKDIIYELTDSLLSRELRKILLFEEITARTIARKFAGRIKSRLVISIILYGSSIKGGATADSDIDVLVIIKNHSQNAEKFIYDNAAELSSKYNKTISPTIITLEEGMQEKDKQFIKSVKENMEVLYGKEPF